MRKRPSQHYLRADGIPIGDDTDRANLVRFFFDDDQRTDVALMHQRDCVCQRFSWSDDVDFTAAYLSDVHDLPSARIYG
jgi:hypothetical protein